MNSVQWHYYVDRVMVSFSCTRCDFGLWIIVQYTHFNLITAINLDTVTKRLILGTTKMCYVLRKLVFECPECDCKYSCNLEVIGSQ